MLSIDKGVLTVPRGVNHEHLAVPIAEILAAEARLHEVAIVTKLKAPELLHTFNDAWRRAHDLVVLLTQTRNKADETAKKRKGVVVLEVAPTILQQRGISSSADARQAVIDQDEEYLKLIDELHQIEAAVELFKGKMKAFENAFTSIKALVREDNAYLNQRNLTGGTGTSRIG